MSAFPEREKLQFPATVETAFHFLAERGFSLHDSEPTIVRYASDRVFLNVYHGRSSYELGIEVGPTLRGAGSDVGYSLGEFVRLVDPAQANRLRYFSATSAEEVQIGIQRLAVQVKEYVRRALDGDLGVFVDLERQRGEWSEKYAAEVMAENVRPKAEAAFRDRDYKRVVELLSKVEGELTPAERKKLNYARRHLPPVPT